MKAPLSLLLCAALSLTAWAAAPAPYDEQADPRADLQRALGAAQTEHKDVLIVFGANWCEDCRALDRAMHASSAALIESRFVVVKVDIGNFDKHLDVAQQYGNPIEKGIPAAVVVSATDQVLYATRAGELANARRMGDTGIYDFFAKVVPQAH